MKMAVPSLSKDAASSWLLDHFEKIIVGFVFLFGVGLIWGGISAIRTQSAPPDLAPEKISSRATAALAHIDAQPQPPAEKLLESRGLPDSLASWVAPAEKDPRKLVLNRPLFDELARRTQPTVFPIEDLRAVAGVAVLAVPAADADPVGPGSRPGFQPSPPGFDPLAGGGLDDMGLGGAGVDPAESVPPARIAPYVVVTGLIPYAKQFTDYQERFENASFRESQVDTPHWSDFLIERADVTSGAPEKWERINLRAVVQSIQKEWAGVQTDALPAEFLLSPEQQPGLAGISYAWPLPQLAMESWGQEAWHPWILSEWNRILAEQTALSATQDGNIMQPFGPGFGTSGVPFTEGGQFPGGFGNQFGPLGGGSSDFGMELLSDPLGMPDNGTPSVEYKLFRFVDTAIKEGHSYRYRVRVSVWNPNYRVPAQHLADADLATATKLPSAASNETIAVTVPAAMGILARTLPPLSKDQELKRDTAEVLVLWPHDKTGNYALHRSVTSLGGMISVEEKPDIVENKGGGGRSSKPRTTQESNLIPVGMLLDYTGQQTVAPTGLKTTTGRRSRKPSPPAEPFELIMIGEDGQLKWASPINSEERYMLYGSTLPPEFRGLPATPMGPDEFSPEGLFPGSR